MTDEHIFKELSENLPTNACKRVSYEPKKATLFFFYGSNWKLKYYRAHKRIEFGYLTQSQHYVTFNWKFENGIYDFKHV